MTEDKLHQTAAASLLAHEAAPTGIGWGDERHVQVNVYGLDVDEGLAKLLMGCWKRGLVTNNSCQDLGRGNGACVAFTDEESAGIFAEVVEECDGFPQDEGYDDGTVVWFAPGSIEAVARVLNDDEAWEGD